VGGWVLQRAWEYKDRGSGDRSLPAGSKGRALVGELKGFYNLCRRMRGIGVPPLAKNVLVGFVQNLRSGPGRKWVRSNHYV